ncbi:hypothetical protein WA026_003106 [Henosepilachna vigintioctopunctata]|uniref:Uncharacterized protein n=1 Tax=Henosepilachna vigintioctopunctata TaxID=420089 RepID=A0AAW1TM76_9CUCU
MDEVNLPTKLKKNLLELYADGTCNVTFGICYLATFWLKRKTEYAKSKTDTWLRSMPQIKNFPIWLTDTRNYVGWEALQFALLISHTLEIMTSLRDGVVFYIRNSFVSRYRCIPFEYTSRCGMASGAQPGSLVPPRTNGTMFPIPGPPHDDPKVELCAHVDTHYDLTTATICCGYIMFGILYTFVALA